MKSFSPLTNIIQLTIILFAYLIFASIFGFAYRYALNPDGLSLLRLAGYIAEGNFQQSLTSGWSPLTTWLISPFLCLGFDGLTAARITIALCGAGLVLCTWFLALRFDLTQNIRLIAVLTVALLISFWTVQFIAADVLVAALTLCYIYLVTDPDILVKRKSALICGIVAGFSYLAHHYALPFFLLHFPVVLALRGYFDRDGEGFPSKRVLISWGAGITGFLIIASVWVGVVSIKYGELTISSKGGIAHAAMGPDDVDRRPPHFYGGLNKPENDYSMHIFEDPSGLEFKTWSPFESREYFMHQLWIMKNNLVDIRNHFITQSSFFTYAFMIAVLVLITITLLIGSSSRRNKHLYSWVVITFCIYCSGFVLLIARSPRRFYALMIIVLLLSFHFLEKMKNALGNIVFGRRKKLLAIFLLVIVVSAFALKPGTQLFKSIRYLVTHEQVNAYAEIAEHINTVEFQSPYAIIRSSQKPHTDTFIAYYLNKQLLGRPLSLEAVGIANELRAAGGRSILVFDNSDIVDKLKNDTQFVHLGSKKIYDERYEGTVNINIRDHELITGWDKELNIFTLNQTSY